jgi:hypothetical protein
MSQLLALSISVAVLGAVWAFLALGPLAPYVLVWAGFITAGCFFATGGDNNALIKTLAGIVYGAIVGWLTLLVIDKVPVPSLGTVWPALVVGFFVFFLVIVASIEQLSAVPANIYGFAMVVAYTLSAGKLADVATVGAGNPLVLVILSAIAGVILGYLMGQAAGLLKAK